MKRDSYGHKTKDHSVVCILGAKFIAPTHPAHVTCACDGIFHGRVCFVVAPSEKKNVSKASRKHEARYFLSNMQGS